VNGSRMPTDQTRRPSRVRLPSSPDEKATPTLSASRTVGEFDR
jgi:hypothetical protein